MRKLFLASVSIIQNTMKILLLISFIRFSSVSVNRVQKALCGKQGLVDYLKIVGSKSYLGYMVTRYSDNLFGLSIMVIQCCTK